MHRFWCQPNRQQVSADKFGASEASVRLPFSLVSERELISLWLIRLHILQTYYCERLGRAVCADVPGFFYGFYTVRSR